VKRSTTPTATIKLEIASHSTESVHCNFKTNCKSYMNLIKLNASYNDLKNRIPHYQINTTVKTALPIQLKTTRLYDSA